MSLFSLSWAGGTAVEQSPQHLLHTHSLPSPRRSVIGKTGVAPALLCTQARREKNGSLVTAMSISQ